jgi:hypothetical protein
MDSGTLEVSVAMLVNILLATVVIYWDANAIRKALGRGGRNEKPPDSATHS